MHVRICPECNEEFRPEIVRCSDCGAMLVDHWEGEEGPVVEAPAPPVATSFRVPADYKPVASASAASEIEPLAQALGQAGIAFAVTGAVHRFTLLVAPDDVERALDVLGVPQAVSDLPAVCPACGADATNAVECAECGLSLAGESETQADPGPPERTD